MLQDSFTNVV